MKNEDVIFSSAVQIINQQTSVEDINRCLELLRFSHMSGGFLVNVIIRHPLIKVHPVDKYRKEAILYQISDVNKHSASEVKPPRYCGRKLYYIRNDRCMYQVVSKGGSNECRKMMTLPVWADSDSFLASHGQCVVILKGISGVTRAQLFEMADFLKVTKLPDLLEPCVV